MKLTLIEKNGNYELLLETEKHEEQLKLFTLPTEATHKVSVKMVNKKYVGYDNSDVKQLNKETLYTEKAIQIKITARKKKAI